MDINVNFSQDQDYRYKMPMPDIRNIGYGNGKRFIFSNIKQIAQKMFKTPEILAKFLQTEMGSRASINPTGQYISTGWSDYQEVLTRLKKFVFTYVLCRHCGNPETQLEVKPNELYFKCMACGKDFTIEKGDYFPLVKMLCREKFKPALSKRNKTKPEEIRGKLYSILQIYDGDVSEILFGQVQSYIQQQAMLEEEIPAVLVSAMCSKVPPSDKFPDELTAILERFQLDIDKQLGILYSIECTYVQWKAIFAEKKQFLAYIFQKLYLSGAIASACFVDFREKQGLSYVPEQNHQDILCDELQVFYEWFLAEGAEEETGTEEEEEAGDGEY